MLLETIKISGGEINVYQDADGYHAERWSDDRQYISAESGDWPTRDEAVEAVTPPVYAD